MSRPRSITGPLLLLAALPAGGCTTAPRVWTEPPPLSVEARAERNARVFDRAADLAADRFFDQTMRSVNWPAAVTRHRVAAVAAPDDESLYTAINALLHELGESHNGALPPRDAFQQRHDTRVATGFIMRRVDGLWVVTTVYPGSAAAQAGVQPGWVVRSRDGLPISERASPFVMKPGQEVHLEFLDPADRVVTLNLIAGPVVWAQRREVRELGEGIVLLRFEEFNQVSIRWLSDQLELRRDAPAVIVDLRGNPGGLLMSVRFAIAEFFPEEVPIGTFVRRDGRERETGSLTLGAARYRGRVAILVDEASASSAEIFSHVLQHHGRAIVVGRTTAGAVIAARHYRLPDGGQLQLAIQDYVGLDGRRLEGAGVVPDVPVTVRLDDLRHGRDADLTAALAALAVPSVLPRS
jgi:carboxyl-terminal processing protease